MSPVHIEQVGGSGLRGEIDARPLGEAGIAAVAGAGIRAAHTSGHVGRAGAHLYAAGVMLDGHMRFTRDGDTVALQPGDIFITDSRREFALDLERPWRHLVFALPCDWLDSRVARPESIAGVVVRGRALARLWATQLRAAFAAAPDLTLGAGVLVARQSLELLAQLLDEHGANRPAPGTGHGAVFAAACHVITATCGSPHVTPATIARTVGVSSRTLARAFARHHESVMRRASAAGCRPARVAAGSSSHDHRHRLRVRVQRRLAFRPGVHCCHADDPDSMAASCWVTRYDAASWKYKRPASPLARSGPMKTTASSCGM